jgi:Flp pilus assembly protein CpaB
VSLLLVVAGCAAAGALLVGSAGRTTEVLVAARSVPAGHPIGAEDLGTARISAAGVRAIAAGDAGTVVGQTAAVPLVHGQLLNRDMLTRQTVPAAGEAMVGLALRPGQLPGAGLEPGDRVSVLAVSGPDTAEPVAVAPRVLAAQATVYAVGSDAATGGDILVTVVVPDAQAGPLAAHSSAGRLAVVKVAAP